MQEDQPTIPLSIAKLIVGFFSDTNTKSELDALDQWVTTDEANQQLFEEFVEITLRPKQPAPHTEDESELVYLADLFMKHLKQTITEDEKLILDEWINSSEKTKSLFNEIPQTNDMELVYHWLLKRITDEQNRIQLN